MAKAAAAKRTTKARPARVSPAKVDLTVSSLKRFTRRDLTTGYVTLDLSSGLNWSHTIGECRGDGIQKLIDELNAAKHDGHADWRAPTAEELFLIADRTKRSPAIDTDAFPDTKNDWYWTGSPVAGVSGASWSVGFGSGFSNWLYRSLHGFVRAVRGPVARAGQ